MDWELGGKTVSSGMPRDLHLRGLARRSLPVLKDLRCFFPEMSLFSEVCPPEISSSPVLDSPIVSSRIQELQVRPGAENLRLDSSCDGRVTLNLPMPHLAGPATEWVGKAFEGRWKGEIFLMNRGDGACYGIALGEPGEPPQAAAYRLYHSLLRQISGLHLHRVWNWVPAINAPGPDGEENYRAFNAGRHAAFTGHFGPLGLVPRLPAASALGIGGNRMALLFAAGNEEPEHFENPEQVPACEYPAEYGRLPPTFARGTRVSSPDGSRRWYLSGTASIKGHETLGESFGDQMSLTLDNVRLMRRHMGVPDNAGARWKVFLRRTEDLAQCRAAFAAAWPADTPATLYLLADICRSNLLVEVEGTFTADPR